MDLEVTPTTGLPPPPRRVPAKSRCCAALSASALLPEGGCPRTNSRCDFHVVKNVLGNSWGHFPARPPACPLPEYRPGQTVGLGRSQKAQTPQEQAAKGQVFEAVSTSALVSSGAFLKTFLFLLQFPFSVILH